MQHTWAPQICFIIGRSWYFTVNRRPILHWWHIRRFTTWGSRCRCRTINMHRIIFHREQDTYKASSHSALVSHKKILSMLQQMQMLINQDKFHMFKVILHSRPETYKGSPCNALVSNKEMQNMIRQTSSTCSGRSYTVNRRCPQRWEACYSILKTKLLGSASCMWQALSDLVEPMSVYMLLTDM